MLMLKNNKTFYLGLFIFLIPFLGLPSSWRTFLVIVSGLLLVAMSVKLSLPGRSVPRRLRHKEKITSVFSQSAPVTKVEDIISPNEQQN
jgi:hypothetical protein